MYISTSTLLSCLLAATASATVIPRDSSPTGTQNSLSCSGDEDCRSYGAICDRDVQRCAGTSFAGSECTVNWNCVSNWCLDGTCKGDSAVGKPCNDTNTDCSTALSDRDYRGIGTDTICPADTGDNPRTCQLGHLGEGDQCTYNDQCAWKRCNDKGVCEKPSGSFGSPCTTQSDCLGGTTCTYGANEGETKECRSPQKGYYGSPCDTSSDCVTKNCGLYGEKFCGLGTPDSCTQDAKTCWKNSDCCSGKCVAGYGFYVCADKARPEDTAGSR